MQIGLQSDPFGSNKGKAEFLRLFSYQADCQLQYAPLPIYILPQAYSECFQPIIFSTK